MLTEVGHWHQGKIWSFTHQVLESKTYIIEADVPGKCILIDPGLDFLALDESLRTLELAPKFIFCTHGHFDHIGGAAHFQKKYNSQVFLHQNDNKELARSNFLLMAFKLPYRIDLPEVTYIETPFSFKLDDVHSLNFLHAPGHTPGSCIIIINKQWFTGDTLYSYGIGLSKLPGEDKNLLKASVLKRWNELPNIDMIFPGHGEPATGQDVVNKNIPLQGFLAEKPEPARE